MAVRQIFTHFPFNYPTAFAEIMTSLVCYNERLPMGTHTSPVMSNFALRQFDLDLQTLVSRFYWTITRYADDISISSKEPITSAHYKIIEQLVRKWKFEINADKVQWFLPNEDKIVTGIVVKKDGLALHPDFIPTLKQDLFKLKNAIELQNFAGSVRTLWITKYKQGIQGKLVYVSNVLGAKNEIYQSLKNEFEAALRPPAEDFGTLSWRFFPYDNQA